MFKNQTVRMLGTFAFSVAFWWLLLGTWQMALGFLALLFVHEMGHYLAAQQKGIRVTLPTFVGPFGAVINMLESPASAADEAYMAYGGPLLGTIGAVITLALSVVMGIPEMALLAKYAFFLNLFNLIPVSPLDGGRVTIAIDRRMWVVGVAAFAGFIYMQGLAMLMNPFNMIILFFIGSWAIRDIQSRKLQMAQNPGYFKVPVMTKLGILTAYLALAGFLYFAITNTGALLNLFVSLGL